MRIRVVVTGRHYQQAGSLPEVLELAEGATVDDAIQLLSASYSNDGPLPASCLLAVSGDHLGTLGDHESRRLCDGDELLLLAPVAGG